MLSKSQLNDALEYLKTSQCQEWLKNEDLMSIYESKSNNVSASCISQILLDVDIDPLKYMGYIPCKDLFKDVIFPTEQYDIPPHITQIPVKTFAHCSNLTSITIPDNITSLGECVFDSCTGLTNIIFKGTREQWRNINKSKYWATNVHDVTIKYTDGKFYKR